MQITTKIEKELVEFENEIRTITEIFPRLLVSPFALIAGSENKQELLNRLGNKAGSSFLAYLKIREALILLEPVLEAQIPAVQADQYKTNADGTVVYIAPPAEETAQS